MITDFGRNSFITWTAEDLRKEREAEIRMRKYRGKTKEGKWVYGWYVDVEGLCFIVPDDATVHNQDTEIMGFVGVYLQTVGQFTGLKDKNGTELDWWDGDVFEVHGRSTLFRIIKEQGCFWFRSEITKERFPCYRVVKWAELPEKLGDSQTIFNQNPE